MAPFIGNPQGISADSLELLDRALSSIWRDELLKRTRPASDVADRPEDRPNRDTAAARAKGAGRASPTKL